MLLSPFNCAFMGFVSIFYCWRSCDTTTIKQFQRLRTKVRTLMFVFVRRFTLTVFAHSGVRTLQQDKRCYRFAFTVRFTTKPRRASISLISAMEAHGSPARHFLDSFNNQRPNSQALRIVNLKALRLDAALPSGVRAPVLCFQGCQP